MTNSNLTTIKSSGEIEDFSAEKLIKSLIGAGAPEELAREIESKIEANPEIAMNTNRIREYVIQKLAENYIPIAARYNIRTAIAQLGPSGYPFEKFMAEVFKTQGYRASTNVIEQGRCVPHELDLVLTKTNQNNNDIKEMVEVKFHSRTNLKTSVKVPLYVHSRYKDLVEKGTHFEDSRAYTGVWIATNTKFSHDAIKYSECSGINLLAWNYPRNQNSLEKIIDREGIHPVTALMSITKEQLRTLIENGIVLCRQIKDNKEKLMTLGFPSEQIDRTIAEAEAIYQLKLKIN